MKRRWLFADQLGPHFLDDDEQPVLLVVSRAAFRRRRYHRQKAHLVVSAMRHRAAELGDRAELVVVERYRDAVEDEELEVCHPTSREARDFVRSLPNVTMLPPRGFVTAPADFVAWAEKRNQLRMEDFYRTARAHHGVLMDGPDPAGGTWNLDAENREPPPRGARALGIPLPFMPTEDGLDESTRAELDGWERDGIEFVGRDGPRQFPVTHMEARTRLDHFLEHRLGDFGPYEDAMLRGDPYMAHSMLSASLNLGLLDPLDIVREAEKRYREGEAPLSSVEGFCRQIMGWRDYVWHCYWYFGEKYPRANSLAARRSLPSWFWELDGDHVSAACLGDVLNGVRDRGWVHHIPRLMVLGNLALQRGWDPAAVTEWFTASFVDGYPWVMVPNVVGMSQYADGGRMTTKPYAAGGAYVNRMSDYCRGCVYDPKHRTGDDACPYTAGYWAFLHRNRDKLAGNHRMKQPLAGLGRLDDLDEVVAAESKRRRF